MGLGCLEVPAPCPTALPVSPPVAEVPLGFSKPFFPASGCQDRAARGREPSQAGRSRDEPQQHGRTGSPESRPPRSQGTVTQGCIRFERERVTTGKPPASRGSVTRVTPAAPKQTPNNKAARDGKDEDHRCRRAPGAIASLRARGWMATNFIAARFLSEDTYSGWLGTGRACVCLPVLCSVQPVCPAPGLRQPGPAASCCSCESQPAAEREGQGSAVTASPPTKNLCQLPGRRGVCF